MLLVVETSTARSSVALATVDDGVLATAELGRDRRHGEFATPAIAQLLGHLGAGVEDLTAVACGIGPGLYTGLRVGLVTAATIAATRELPCIAVTGPDAIAASLRHAAGDVVVALDARRREVYASRHRPTGGGADRLGELEVTTPAALAEGLVEDPPALLAGDGAATVVAAADGALDDVSLAGPAHDNPTAAMMVPLALAALVEGRTGGVELLRPLYLREADAKIGWDQRGRLRGGAAR